MPNVASDLRGFHDIPTPTDSLSISPYIRSLSQFIVNCPTPMTIAVQGNWGTGKTSAMLQVDGILESNEQISTIFFNTWQYSQFDLGENLAINMLRTIADSLDLATGNRPNNKVAKFKDSLFKVSKAVVINSVPVALTAAGFGFLAPGAKAGLETAAEGDATPLEPVDNVSLLASLRDDFQGAVAETGKRLVVFVDDLDRLEPKRAIEVMEAIKVFLDVPNCVFVLAIDFDVVKLGVQEKYGSSVTERKARSFFDKIIQVPFHMPVARYQMRTLFEQGLGQLGIRPTNEDYDSYMALSSASVGSNPRSTKRLLNTFLLLKTVLDSESAEMPDIPQPNFLHVFGTLCLQTAFPEIYNAFGDSLTDDFPSDTFRSYLLTESNDRVSEWGINDDDVKISSRFLEKLEEIFKVDGKLDDEAFNRAFDQSTITSVSSSKNSAAPRTKVFDAGERRSLTEAKRSRAVVDLAFAFEKFFTNSQDAFAAQTDPAEWTIRLAPDQPRLGLLTIRPNAIRLAMEFRTNAPETWEPVEAKLTKALADSSLDGSVLKGVALQRKIQATKNYTIFQLDHVTTLEQAAELAALLKPFYVGLV